MAMSSWTGAGLILVIAAGLALGAEPRNILVFGGNGLIGADTVSLFIDNGDKVTVVNRGNWYWDSGKRIRPFVNAISCDRNEDIDSCTQLVALVRKTPMFDAVVDFSGYGAKQTKETSALLRGKVKIYILVSSDSVYEICDKQHDGLTKETDGVRLADNLDDSGIWDSYYDKVPAHTTLDYPINKFNAEQELIKQRLEKQGIPYVFIRIPDVIGPRDTTFRWWAYQTWIKLESRLEARPLSIPDFTDTVKCGFVYSPDVARVITMVLSRGPEVHDEAFNVAFTKHVTLREAIGEIRKYLGIENTEVKLESKQSDTLYVWPTVRKGPLDVTKVREMLGWEPTPWDEAIKETVSFFEKAMTSSEFIVQRNTIVKDLSNQLFGGYNEDVYKAAEEAYGIKIDRPDVKDRVEL